MEIISLTYNLRDVHHHATVACHDLWHLAVPLLNHILLDNHRRERSSDGAVIIGFCISFDLHGLGITFSLGNGNFSIGLSLLHLVFGFQSALDGGILGIDHREQR